ncbi:MAG TPA: SirB2 family protein [Pseudomonadales bacterium]
MLLLKEFHVALAYITVAGFVVRGLLSLAESPLRNQRWLRIAPHVIDTLLLGFGIALAVSMSLSPAANGWLMAKIVGLLAYIGFGVMAMRARSRPLKIAGFIVAIASVGYIFSVAYSKRVMPF